MSTQHHSDAVTAIAARLTLWGIKDPLQKATELIEELRDDLGWRPFEIPRHEPPKRTPAAPETVTALLADFRDQQPKEHTS